MTKREAIELYLGLGLALLGIGTVLLAGRYASTDCLASVVIVILGVFLIVKLRR